MKYTIGIRLSDEDEAKGTDLAQHGVQLPYVPYMYVPQIDEMIIEHNNVKAQRRKNLNPDNYFFEFSEDDYWKETFPREDELEQVRLGMAYGMLWYGICLCCRVTCL